MHSAVWSVTGTAVTVAALAAVAACERSGHEASSGPGRAATGRTSQLPVPYLAGPWLHVGETTIELKKRANYELRYAGGTVLVGEEYGYGPWFEFENGELVKLPTGELEVDPLLSGDGDTVAWVHRGNRSTDFVVAWDLTANRELGRIPIDRRLTQPSPPPPEGNGRASRELVGVDNSGRVYWRSRGNTVAGWRPGTDPVVVTGLTDVAWGQPWPKGLTEMSPATGMGREAFEEEGAVGTIGDDGAFRPVAKALNVETGVWSPDGRHRAFQPNIWGNEGAQYRHPDPVLVQDLEGHIVELQVPLTLRESWPVAWESPTVVVVHASTTLLRCDVTDRSCTVAIRGLPKGVTLPDAE